MQTEQVTGTLTINGGYAMLDWPMVKRMRARLGWSRAEMSRRAHNLGHSLSAETIQHGESGNAKKTTFEIACALAVVLDVSLDKLKASASGGGR